MDRIFYPYWLWEDVKAGILKEGFSDKDVEVMSLKAKELLSNNELFFETALKVINEWKYSAAFNLSNPSRNHQAWIGQASCCYLHGIPEYITKLGWRLLDFDQQVQANIIADKIIKIWEDNQIAKEDIKQKRLSSY